MFVTISNHFQKDLIYGIVLNLIGKAAVNILKYKRKHMRNMLIQTSWHIVIVQLS